MVILGIILLLISLVGFLRLVIAGYDPQSRAFLTALNQGSHWDRGLRVKPAMTEGGFGVIFIA